MPEYIDEPHMGAGESAKLAAEWKAAGKPKQKPIGPGRTEYEEEAPASMKEALLKQGKPYPEYPWETKLDKYRRDIADLVNYWKDIGLLNEGQAKYSYADAVDQALLNLTKPYQWPHLDKIAEYKNKLPALQRYNLFKEDILSNPTLNYNQKMSQLLDYNPDAGSPEVFRQMKEEVVNSLPIEQLLSHLYHKKEAVSPRRVELWHRKYDLWRKNQPTDTGTEAEFRTFLRGQISPRRKPRVPAGYPPTEPAIRFEPAFETERMGLTGPQSWMDWFERQYSTLLWQYRAQPEKPTEAGWVQYLKAKKPALKEEWWELTAPSRLGREAVFAPPIQTVRF